MIDTDESGWISAMELAAWIHHPAADFTRGPFFVWERNRACLSLLNRLSTRTGSSFTPPALSLYNSHNPISTDNVVVQRKSVITSIDIASTSTDDVLRAGYGGVDAKVFIHDVITNTQVASRHCGKPCTVAPTYSVSNTFKSIDKGSK